MPNDTDKADDVTVDEDFDAADHAGEYIEPLPTKRGVGWGVVLPLFVLASGLGAAGGWAATRVLSPPPQQGIALKSADITQMQTRLTAMTARMDRLETSVDGQSASLKQLRNEINSKPATISFGGNAPQSVGGAGQSPTDEATPINTDAMNDVLAKINALENRFADLQSDMTAQAAVSASPGTTPRDMARAPTDPRFEILQGDIDGLRDRVDSLETGLTETRSIAAQPTIIKKAVLLPAFPRGAVFDALTEDPLSRDAGWMKRTLKKHISVRNPDAVKQADRQLDAVAQAIEAGDIVGARAIVEAMPAPALKAASDWLDAAKQQGG